MRIRIVGTMSPLDLLGYRLIGALLVVSKAVSADVGLANGINNTLATSFGVLRAGPGLVVSEDVLTLGTRVGVPMSYEVAGVDAESAKGCRRSGVDWLRCRCRVLEADLWILDYPLGPWRSSYLK